MGVQVFSDVFRIAASFRYSRLRRISRYTITGNMITISHAPSVNFTSANSTTTNAV